MIDPIFIAEAAVNGILLGGILALLALGLNLIFGVIDIVWIAYVDLVMLCMYAMYFLVQVYGWPVWAAGLASLVLGALLGVGVHLLIITPILGSPPVNQLLATGGLLFFIQSFATFLWTTDHKSVRLSPAHPTRSAGIFLPAARIIPFVISILAMVGALPLPHPDLHGHGDPRRVPGPRRHGADGRQPAARSTSSPRRWAGSWRGWRGRCSSSSTRCTRSSAASSGRSPS